MLQDPEGCLWDRQPLQLLPQHAQECSFQRPHHFIRLPVYTHFTCLGRKVSCTCGFEEALIEDLLENWNGKVPIGNVWQALDDELNWTWLRPTSVCGFLRYFTCPSGPP